MSAAVVSATSDLLGKKRKIFQEKYITLSSACTSNNQTVVFHFADIYYLESRRDEATPLHLALKQSKKKSCHCNYNRTM